MNAFEAIGATEAVEVFKKRKITVQTATPIKEPAKALSGKPGQRDTFDVKYVPLRAEHIMAAKKYLDGRVSIVTIDGRRYEEPERPKHPGAPGEP